MLKSTFTLQNGFTLVEMMTTIAISTIVIMGIGIVLVDSHRLWNDMYNRIYSDVVTDGYVARKVFDTIVRKASCEKLLVDENGNWLEVYYYHNLSSSTPDCYARFYYEDGGENNGRLNVEYGRVDPRETLSIYTVCENVSACSFKGIGRSAQMILTLNDGNQTITVVSSAVMQNQ